MVGSYSSYEDFIFRYLTYTLYSLQYVYVIKMDNRARVLSFYNAKVVAPEPQKNKQKIIQHLVAMAIAIGTNPFTYTLELL